MRREVRVTLDPGALAAHGLGPAAVHRALAGAASALPAGSVTSGGREVLVEAGDLLRSAEEVGEVVLAAPDGRPVRLRQVAEVADGPAEPREYVLHARAGAPAAPAVTLAVSKTRGANATDVARAVLARIEEERGQSRLGLGLWLQRSMSR